MMVLMLPVVSPMSAVGWGSGIIGIRISGIRIIVDVWVTRVSVGIIIKVPRISVIAARKSKTQSFRSGNQDGGLSVGTLHRNKRPCAYRQCDYEKFLHSFCVSVCCFAMRVSRR